MLRKLVSQAANAAQAVAHRIMNYSSRSRGVLEMRDTLVEDKYEQDTCAYCKEKLDSPRQDCQLVQCKHRFHFKCLTLACSTSEKKGFMCPACSAKVQRVFDESSSKCMPIKQLEEAVAALPARPSSPTPPNRRNGIEYRVPEENAMLLGAIPVLASAEEDRRREREIEERIGAERAKEKITVTQFINEFTSWCSTENLAAPGAAAAPQPQPQRRLRPYGRRPSAA